jgi:hypothetical protein
MQNATTVNVMYLGNEKQRYLKAYYKDLQSFKSFGCSLKIWTENDVKKLLADKYEKDLSLAYDSIVPYGYKSDVARLAILNYYGGWYADLGVRLVSKLPETANIDFLGFLDHPAKDKWSGLSAMQTAFIYATPNNDYINIILKKIIKRCKEKDYGRNHHDVTGPVLWGSVFDKVCGVTSTRLKVGDFGILTQNERLAYSIDNKIFALFKDQNINNNLKSIGKYDTDYALAWDEKAVYY